MKESPRCLERFPTILTHLDEADFGPLQEGEAREYVDISSFAAAAVGQNGRKPL
ncbi:hypothetical protein [Qipengyuania sp. ASV99]|uniref:hypothetical protein n=1 Tax=Qipengyuania sp. ASV99 TaxID=3399681 RepID=UPI003A4C6037